MAYTPTQLDPNFMRWLQQQGPVTGADLPPDVNGVVPFGGSMDTAMAQDQGGMAPPQYGDMPPTAPQSPATPGSGFSMPDLNGGAGTALNLAGILGGLGLGLYRPRIGPQALQNFSAANTMQWRDDQKEFSRQRLELAQQAQAQQLATLAQMNANRAGEAGPSSAPPSQGGTQQFTAPPPAPPQVSEVPHYALGQPGGPGAAPQFEPQGRMAAQPDQPFFAGQPQPILGNTSESLSAFGQSQTRSTNRGTAKEQATNNAVNDLTQAWIQNPDQAQQNPRRLLKEVLARNPQADSKAVRENLSNTLFETYHSAVLQDQPGLDPKSAYRQAYGAAAKDLGPGMFVPTDQMRTLATQVASVEEQYGLASSQDDTGRLGTLNQREQVKRAGIRGAENAADIYTKGMSPSDLQSFENPPPIGSTMGDVMRRGGGQRPTQAGQMGLAPSNAPMSKARETGLNKREMERSETQTAVETVAPTIANIVRKAEEVRNSFSNNSLQDFVSRGKNWLDVAQGQITGFPMTEMGKLVQSYDTLVQTNGPLMARVVQAQRGNLTEQERIIGQQGFPATFRELYNNPVAGNDRLSVLGDVMALELRDPTFRLGRLDSPMSEFEKSVEMHRQQRIATRPELYTNAPQLPGAPMMAPQQAPATPPSLPSHMLSPEDQATIDQVNKELQGLKKRP